MNPVIIAYLVIAAIFVMAIFLAINILVKRFMPIGCIFLFLGFILVMFVYTLNH